MQYALSPFYNNQTILLLPSGPLLGQMTAQWPIFDTLLPSLTAKILPFPDNSSPNLSEGIGKTIPPKPPSTGIRAIVV